MTIATRLARWSIAAPIIFAGTWTVLGLLRPGYSCITQPISGLGVGPGAAFMNAAFIVVGLLLVGGPIGSFLLIKDVAPIGRWSSAILLALTGVGAVMCGLFTWESFTPHMIGSFLGLAGPFFGCLVAGFVLGRSPRWRMLGGTLVGAAALTLVLTVAFFATFRVDAVLANRGVAGLLERVLTTEGQAWYAVLAVAATRGAPRASSALPHATAARLGNAHGGA